jgi:hypothetical protein
MIDNIFKKEIVIDDFSRLFNFDITILRNDKSNLYKDESELYQNLIKMYNFIKYYTEDRFDDFLESRAAQLFLHCLFDCELTDIILKIQNKFLTENNYENYTLKEIRKLIKEEFINTLKYNKFACRGQKGFNFFEDFYYEFREIFLIAIEEKLKKDEEEKLKRCEEENKNEKVQETFANLDDEDIPF